MSTADTLPLPGHRERKKAQTRRAIALATRRLVFAHGFDAVTVQDIAAAADVSPRTFFNYFGSKEEAAVGVDPSALEDLTVAIAERPAHESPAGALVNTLMQVGSPEAAEGWVQRVELVALHPVLLPRHLAAMSAVEDALAGAIAARSGLDSETDPRPAMIVAAAVGVLRCAFSSWVRSDRSRPLDRVLADAFSFLTTGLDLP
jgi:AcrR family transcriptional regulator